MKWRLIEDLPRSAFLNMAVDEAVCESVRDRLSPPTLRLYSWMKPAVSIGYFQKTSDIHAGYCARKGYPIVRRATGGTAVFHGTDVTYSFSARTDSAPFSRRLLENCSVIGEALSLALRNCGIDAQMCTSRNRGSRSPLCFTASSYGEITVRGRKIAGSAQKLYREHFLQQGSVFFHYDREETARIINPSHAGEDVPGDRLCDEITTSEIGLRFRTALTEAFETVFRTPLYRESLTETEWLRAGRLETGKYSTREWNFRR